MSAAGRLVSMLPGRSPRVIVAGGLRGFIGKNLCRNLTKDGYELDVITTADRTLTGLTWGEASHEFNTTLSKPRPCDALINVSGAPIFANLWNYQQRENVVERRVETNEVLAGLVRGAARPPQVFVHISDRGVFGRAASLQQAPQRSEQDAPAAGDWWADMCQRWEAAAALPGGHPTRRVCLRPGWVLGADAGLLAFARRWYGRGLAAYAAPGTQPFPWIHIEDLVALVRFALDHGGVAGVLHAVAPEQLTQADAAGRLAARLKTGTPAALPQRLLELALHRERAQLLCADTRLVSTRLAELGFRFKFPTLDAALDDLLARPLPREHVPQNPNYSHLDPSAVPQHPPVEAHHH